jgi:PhnB protein
MKMVPYLKLHGNCEEVLNYYRDLLDGEITYIQRYGEAPEGMWEVKGNENKIMHASLLAGGVVLYFSDILGSEGHAGEGSVALTLELEPEEDMEAIYNDLSKDGTVLVPIQDTFWNARHATVLDKFGFNWIINQEKA